MRSFIIYNVKYYLTDIYFIILVALVLLNLFAAAALLIQLLHGERRTSLHQVLRMRPTASPSAGISRRSAQTQAAHRCSTLQTSTPRSNAYRRQPTPRRSAEEPRKSQKQLYKAIKATMPKSTPAPGTTLQIGKERRRPPPRRLSPCRTWPRRRRMT